MTDHHTNFETLNQRSEPVILNTPVPDTPAAASPDTPTDPLVGLIGTFLHHLQGSLLDYVIGEYVGDFPQLAAQLRDPAVSLADKRHLVLEIRRVRRQEGRTGAALPEGLQTLLTFMDELARLQKMLGSPVSSVRGALQRAQYVTEMLRTLAWQLKPSPGRERVMYWLEQLAGGAVLAQDLSGITSVAEGLDLTQRLLAESDAPAWLSPLLSLAETVVARLLLQQAETPDAVETPPEAVEETPAGRLQAFAAAYRSARGTAEKLQRWLAVLSDAQLLPALEPYLPAVLRGSAGVLSLLGELVAEADGAGLAGMLRQTDRLLSPDFLRRLAAQGAAGEVLAAPLVQLGGYYNAAASRRAVTLLVRLSNRERLLQGSDLRLLLEPQVLRVGASMVSAPAAAVDALWRLLSGIQDYTPGGVLAALRQDLVSPSSALLGLLRAVCPQPLSAGLVLGQRLFQAGWAWGRGDWSGLVTGLTGALAGAIVAAGGTVAEGLVALVTQLVMAGALYAYRDRPVTDNEWLVGQLKVLMASSPDDPLVQAQRQYIDWWPALVVLRQQAVWPEEAAEVDPARAGLPGWLATVSGLLASEKLRWISGVERLRQRLEQQVGEWLGEGLAAVLTSAGQKTAAEYAGGQSPVAQAVAVAVGGAQGWFARLGEGLSGAANMALVFNMLAVAGEPAQAAGESAVPGPVVLEDERGEGYRFLLPEGEDPGHSLWFWTGGAGAVMTLLGGLLWWLSHQGAGWRRALAAGDVRPYGSEEVGAAFLRGDEEAQDAVTLLAGREDRVTQAQGSGTGPEGARLTAASGEAAEVPAMTRGQDVVMRHFGNAGRVAKLLTGTGLLTAALSGVGKWRSMQSEPQAQEVRGSASYEATLRSLEREGGAERRATWLRQRGYLEVNIPQVEADFTLWQRLRSGGTVEGAALADLVRRLHSRDRLAPEGEKAVGVLYDVRARPGLAEGRGLQLTLKSSTGRVLHEAMYSARGLGAAGEWHLSVARQINADMAESGLAGLGVSVRRVQGGAESTTFAAGPGPTATDNVILARAGSGVASAEWEITTLSEQYGERVENPAGTSSLMQEFTAQRVLSDGVLAQGGTPGAMSYEDIPEARRARLLAREAWYREEAAAREPGENGAWVYGEASRTAYTRLAGEMRVAANRLIVSDTARADWIAGLNGVGHQPDEEEQQYQQLRISELLLDSPTGLVWRDDDVLLVTYTGEGGRVRREPFRLTDVVNRRHLEARYLRAGETAAVAWWPGLVQEDASRAEEEKKIPALAGLRDEWRLQQQVKGESERQAREKTALGNLNPDLGRFTFARWSEARIRKIAQEEGVTGLSGGSEVLLDFGLMWEETTADGTPVDAPALAVQERVSLREIAWGYLRRLALQAGRQEKYTRMGRPGAGRGQGEGAGKSKTAQLSEETQFAGNAEGVARVAQRIAAADFYEEYRTWLGQYRRRSAGRPSGLSRNITGVVRARLAAMPGQGNYRNVALAPEREFLTGVVQREYADGRVVMLSLLDNRQWLFADRAAVNAAWRRNENGLRSVLSQRQRYDKRQSTPGAEEGDFQYATQLEPVNFISKRIMDDLEQEADRLSVSQDEYRMLTMLEDLKTVLELASALVMPLAPASTLFGLGGAVLTPLIQRAFADEEGEKRGYLQEALLGAVFELGGEFLLGPLVKRLTTSDLALRETKKIMKTDSPSEPEIKIDLKSRKKSAASSAMQNQNWFSQTEPVIGKRNFEYLTQDELDAVHILELLDNKPAITNALANSNLDSSLDAAREIEKVFTSKKNAFSRQEISSLAYLTKSEQDMVDLINRENVAGNIKLSYMLLSMWGSVSAPRSHTHYVVKLEFNYGVFIIDMAAPNLANTNLGFRHPVIQTENNWLNKYQSTSVNPKQSNSMLMKLTEDSNLNNLVAQANKPSAKFADSYDPNARLIKESIGYISHPKIKSVSYSKDTGKVEKAEIEYNGNVYNGEVVTINGDMKLYKISNHPADRVFISSHGAQSPFRKYASLPKGKEAYFYAPNGYTLLDPGPGFKSIPGSAQYSHITSNSAQLGHNFGQQSGKVNRKLPKNYNLYSAVSDYAQRGIFGPTGQFRNNLLSYYGNTAKRNNWDSENPLGILRTLAYNRYAAEELKLSIPVHDFITIRNRGLHNIPAIGNVFLPSNRTVMKDLASLHPEYNHLDFVHCRGPFWGKESGNWSAKGYTDSWDLKSGKLLEREAHVLSWPKSKLNVPEELIVPSIDNADSDVDANRMYDITNNDIWNKKMLWQDLLGFNLLNYSQKSWKVNISVGGEKSLEVSAGDVNEIPRWKLERSVGTEFTSRESDYFEDLISEDDYIYLLDIMDEDDVKIKITVSGDVILDGELSGDLLNEFISE